MGKVRGTLHDAEDRVDAPGILRPRSYWKFPTNSVCLCPWSLANADWGHQFPNNRSVAAYETALGLALVSPELLGTSSTGDQLYLNMIDYKTAIFFLFTFYFRGSREFQRHMLAPFASLLVSTV